LDRGVVGGVNRRVAVRIEGFAFELDSEICREAILKERTLEQERRRVRYIDRSIPIEIVLLTRLKPRLRIRLRCLQKKQDRQRGQNSTSFTRPNHVNSSAAHHIKNGRAEM
jgi:hypothetical protein